MEITPRELLERTMESLRHTKDYLVQKDGIDAAQLPQIEMWRDGEPIILITAEPDRATIADLITLGIASFRAESVMVAYDAWHANQLINPDTGQEWDASRDEQAHYVATHGRDNGVVYESVNASVWDVDGTVGGALMPYTPFTSPLGASRVRWGDAEIFLREPGNSLVGGGLFAEAAQAGFERLAAGQSLLQDLRDAHTEIGSDEELDALLDVVALQTLLDTPRLVSAMLTCRENQPGRRKIIERKMHRRMADSVRGALEIELNLQAAPWN